MKDKRGGEFSYRPNGMETGMHNILHISLDSRLEVMSNNFTFTHNVFWSPYIGSLLTVPIICNVAILVACLVLSYILYFYVYRRKETHTVLNTDIESTRNLMVEDFKDENEYSVSELTSFISNTQENDSGFDAGRLISCKYLCCNIYEKYIKRMIPLIILLLLAQTLVICFSVASGGFDKWFNLMDYIKSMSSTLLYEGYELYDFGISLGVDFTMSVDNGCDEARVLLNTTAYYMHFINKYIRELSPVPNTCDDITHGINQGYSLLQLYIFSIYGLVMLLCLTSRSLILNHCSETCLGLWRTRLTKLLSGLSWVILWVANFCMMALAIGMGDFCMLPIENIKQVLIPSIVKYSDFYATCTGQNPFQQYLNWAYGWEHATEDAVNRVLTFRSCQDDPFLLDSLVILQNLSTTLTTMNSQIVCAPLQDRYVTFLQDGICGDAFNGLFFNWLSQQLLLFSVVLLMISALYTIPSNFKEQI